MCVGKNINENKKNDEMEDDEPPYIDHLFVSHTVRSLLYSIKVENSDSVSLKTKEPRAFIND